jgi:hypothetical protein
MEARLANRHSINITDHALLSSTLVRLAQRIGIDRRSRNITPSPVGIPRIAVEAD